MSAVSGVTQPLSAYTVPREVLIVALPLRPVPPSKSRTRTVLQEPVLALAWTVLAGVLSTTATEKLVDTAVMLVLAVSPMLLTVTVSAPALVPR